METTRLFDPRQVTGFTQQHLADAFDRVRDPRDWMAPIVAEVDRSDQSLVEQAVLWFTDSAPSFEPVPGQPDRVSVSAPGFRLGPTGRAAWI
ncbi:MAG: hypothetical protein SGI84_10065 [Gemmatimonadota bacterium]|nr:hypothetical protein [Gemmatimonadota bacterium]